MQWPGQGIHSLSASFPWEGSLTEPGARVAASKPQWYLRHLSPQCRSYRHMQPCLGFYVGTGDLNLGPHNSPASVLTHWAWVQDFIHTTCAALSQNCRIVYKYIDKVIHGLYFPLFTFDIILPKLFCMSPTYTWKYFVEPKQGQVLSVLIFSSIAMLAVFQTAMAQQCLRRKTEVHYLFQASRRTCYCQTKTVAGEWASHCFSCVCKILTSFSLKYLDILMCHFSMK